MANFTRPLWFAVAFTVAALASLPAHADTVVVLPPEGDVPVGDENLTEATQALSRALSELGHQAVAWEQAAQMLRERRAEACGDVACSHQIMRALGAQMTVILRIWLRSGGVPREVSVRAVGADTHGVAIVPVSPGALPAAVRSATRRAVADLGRDSGVLLRVAGRPVGASVVVDRRPVGRLPWQGLVAPGTHEVSVAQDGYQEHLERLELRRSADPMAVTVSLSRAVVPAPDRQKPLLGPLLLGGAGVALVGVATYGALSPGERCAREQPSGACTRIESATNVPATVGYGALGVASIVGAALWYFLDDPASVDVAGTPDGGRLRLIF